MHLISFKDSSFDLLGILTQLGASQVKAGLTDFTFLARLPWNMQTGDVADK